MFIGLTLLVVIACSVANTINDADSVEDQNVAEGFHGAMQNVLTQVGAAWETQINMIREKAAESTDDGVKEHLAKFEIDLMNRMKESQECQKLSSTVTGSSPLITLMQCIGGWMLQLLQNVNEMEAVLGLTVSGVQEFSNQE